MKLRLLDMDKVTKHESSRNVGHPAMTWTFAMVVTGKSGTGKLIYLQTLFLVIRMNMCKRGRKAGLDISAVMT